MEHKEDIAVGAGLAAFHLTQTLLWILIRRQLLPPAAAIDALSALPTSLRERYADGSVAPEIVESAISLLETLRLVLDHTDRERPTDGNGSDAI